jgi:hypothetical protein
MQMANVGKTLQEAKGLVKVAEHRRSLKHSNLFGLCKLAIMQRSVGAVRVRAQLPLRLITGCRWASHSFLVATAVCDVR